MIPSTRLWVMLSLLSLPAMAAGFVPGVWPIVLLLDAVILLVAAADWSLARAAKLELWRELPSRLSVGVPNRVTLHLVNEAGRPLRPVRRDHHAGRLPRGRAGGASPGDVPPPSGLRRPAPHRRFAPAGTAAGPGLRSRC